MGGDWHATRGLPGGKGADLGDMTRIGVPVPPGFVMAAEACNAFSDADGVVPDGRWDQAVEAMTNLEVGTGKNRQPGSRSPAPSRSRRLHHRDRPQSGAVNRTVNLASGVTAAGFALNSARVAPMSTLVARAVVGFRLR